MFKDFVIVLWEVRFSFKAWNATFDLKTGIRTFVGYVFFAFFLIFHNVFLHKEKPKSVTNLSSNKMQNRFKELCEESCKVVQT